MPVWVLPVNLKDRAIKRCVKRHDQCPKADLAPPFSATLLEITHTYTNMLANYDDRSKTFKPKLTRLSM